MAAAGVASRRASEELIVQGRVKVNGKVVRELGTRIDPLVDQVMVNGQPVQMDPERIYFAFNKPKGVTSTMSDEGGKRCLADYFQEFDHIFNVGRLDKDTTGLLIMTNDGELANQLMHPRYEVEKLYVAKVMGKIGKVELQRLKDGVKLEDGFQRADRVRVVDQNDAFSLVEIVLHSGKNRIVRRMFEAVGHPVIDLTRKSFGPIHLKTLKLGRYRELSKLEVSSLMQLGLTRDK